MLFLFFSSFGFRRVVLVSFLSVLFPACLCCSSENAFFSEQYHCASNVDSDMMISLAWAGSRDFRVQDWHFEAAGLLRRIRVPFLFTYATSGTGGASA
ncbi:hypothetical protein BJX96DRAFT_153812 [Aspergillus floccosus]